jgi:hypothetical protein
MSTEARRSPEMKIEHHTAKAHPGAKLILSVTHADNEVIAYLNTDQIYDRKTENDPPLNDTVDLSNKLVKGHNSVVILGINWGGPAHFDGNLTLDGKVIVNLTYALPSTPNGVAAAWSADIVVD